MELMEVEQTISESVTKAAQSMSEKLSYAGQNTLICICVVFAVLIFISLIISLFGIFPKIEAKKASKKALLEEEKKLANDAIDNVVSQIVTKETEESNADASENLVDDLELVAVIAAAIAASEGAASTDGFVVRSIRKVRR